MWTQWVKLRGGTDLETNMETYALPYVKQIASGNLMYDAGHPKPVLCDSLEGWGGEHAGRRVQERGHTFPYGRFMLIYGRGHHNIVK